MLQNTKIFLGGALLLSVLAMGVRRIDHQLPI